MALILALFFLFFFFKKQTLQHCSYSKIQKISVLWIQPFIKETKIFHEVSMLGSHLRL